MLLALSLALVVALPVAPGDTTQASTEREVLSVVEKLFAAMRTKDTVAFRDVFEPTARLVGIRKRANGDQIVQVLGWEQFMRAAVTDKREPWIERAFNPVVTIRGTLATVWAEYDFHFGSRPSHCGVDAVQLLRTSAGWKILSIADTYETEGCPQRPTPR